jgi:hypothetical protein
VLLLFVRMLQYIWLTLLFHVHQKLITVRYHSLAPGTTRQIHAREGAHIQMQKGGVHACSSPSLMLLLST